MTRSLSGLSNSSCRAASNVDALGEFFASKLSLSGDFAAQYHVDFLLLSLGIHGGYDCPGFLPY